MGVLCDGHPPGWLRTIGGWNDIEGRAEGKGAGGQTVGADSSRPPWHIQVPPQSENCRSKRLESDHARTRNNVPDREMTRAASMSRSRSSWRHPLIANMPALI